MYSVNISTVSGDVILQSRDVGRMRNQRAHGYLKIKSLHMNTNVIKSGKRTKRAVVVKLAIAYLG